MTETRFSFSLISPFALPSLRDLSSIASSFFPFKDLSQEDYLGIGLRAGMIHLAWNLGWKSRTELTLPRPRINDGAWHRLQVSRVRQTLELRVDGELFGSKVEGSYSELNVNATVLVGGPAASSAATATAAAAASKSSASVLDLSRGHFAADFRGCVRDLVVQSVRIDSFEPSDDLSGVNVYNCQNSN